MRRQSCDAAPRAMVPTAPTVLRSPSGFEELGVVWDGGGGEEGGELIVFVAADEVAEGFAGVAVGGVGVHQVLHAGAQIFGHHLALDVVHKGAALAQSAADAEVEALMDLAI